MTSLSKKNLKSAYCECIALIERFANSASACPKGKYLLNLECISSLRGSSFSTRIRPVIDHKFNFHFSLQLLTAKQKDISFVAFLHKLTLCMNIFNDPL